MPVLTCSTRRECAETVVDRSDCGQCLSILSFSTSSTARRSGLATQYELIVLIIVNRNDSATYEQIRLHVTKISCRTLGSLRRKSRVNKRQANNMQHLKAPKLRKVTTANDKRLADASLRNALLCPSSAAKSSLNFYAFCHWLICFKALSLFIFFLHILCSSNDGLYESHRAS